MRPAVITAVLLLVGIINTVTAISYGEVQKMCWGRLKAFCDPGDDYWRTNKRGGGCMKYFEFPKTFQEAQDHCLSVDSELISIHDEDDMLDAMCMSFHDLYAFKLRSFWIGAKRSGDGFKYTDGTEFNYTNWNRNEPNNNAGVEDCVEANLWVWSKWNDNRCSAKKDFVCMKKK